MCYDLYCVLYGVVNWNILDNTELKELNEKLDSEQITEKYYNRLKKRLSYVDNITIMRKDDFNFHKCENIDCKFEYYCTDDSEHNNPDDYYSYRVLTGHKENISNQEAKSSKIILSKLIHYRLLELH